ncbi:MAG: hypothetical protein COB15_01210 [Flavobacteriales bacterium]|nr:MAG: hypothetical protein COB15_01210 [Flavobacteriales bacterium]
MVTDVVLASSKKIYKIPDVGLGWMLTEGDSNSSIPTRVQGLLQFALKDIPESMSPPANVQLLLDHATLSTSILVCLNKYR